MPPELGGLGSLGGVEPGGRPGSLPHMPLITSAPRTGAAQMTLLLRTAPPLHCTSELRDFVFHGQPGLELDDSLFSIITDNGQTDLSECLDHVASPATPHHLWSNCTFKLGCQLPTA